MNRPDTRAPNSGAVLPAGPDQAAPPAAASASGTGGIASGTAANAGTAAKAVGTGAAAIKTGARPLRPGLLLAARITGGLMLGGCLLFRDILELTMLGHMMAQLTMILLGGMLLFGHEANRSERLASYDRHGLAGLAALLFVSAYWMVPRALELSLTQPLVELAKFVSIAALGAILPGSLSRANAVIQLFFLGNFCAMTAIAGMLYQDVPEQLCNAYMQDDQARTGAFLITVALGAAMAWFIRTFPALRN